MTVNDVTKYVFHGVKASITSNFGSRTYYDGNIKISDFHTGIDYISKSEKIYAIRNGVVQSVGYDNVSGNYIYIKYNKLGVRIFYCHLKKIYLKKGDKVNKDTLVGLMGTTGNSTGVHLHLGVKYIGSNKWVNPKYISLTKYNYTYIASEFIKVKTKKTKDYVNLRESASIKSKVLKTIPINKNVSIIKENIKKNDGYTFDKVKYGNTVGYIANKYLETINYKTIDDVNVRIKPGTTSEVVTTLKKGSVIKVIRKKVEKKNGYYWDEIKI